MNQAERTKTQILPFGNRLAVIDPPAEDQEKTASGLYLAPGSVTEALRKGIVESVGEGYDPTSYPGWQVKVGDVVWYKWSSTHEIGDTTIIEVDDVVAIERNEEN